MIDCVSVKVGELETVGVGVGETEFVSVWVCDGEGDEVVLGVDDIVKV